MRVREDRLVDVVRMRKNDGDGLARPIIEKFKSEYDEWTVLRNKSDLGSFTLVFTYFSNIV